MFDEPLDVLFVALLPIVMLMMFELLFAFADVDVALVVWLMGALDVSFLLFDLFALLLLLPTLLLSFSLPFSSDSFVFSFLIGSLFVLLGSESLAVN